MDRNQLAVARTKTTVMCALLFAQTNSLADVFRLFLAESASTSLAFHFDRILKMYLC